MLFKISNTVVHPDHTVMITWLDGVKGMVEQSPAAGLRRCNAAGMVQHVVILFR